MYGIGYEEGGMETKFKVGDRVKVLVDEWAPDAGIGMIGVVHEAKAALNGEGYTVKMVGGDGFAWFFFEDQLELAPAEQVQGDKAGRYRVGDRVRLNCNYGSGKIGNIGTISKAYSAYSDTFYSASDIGVEGALAFRFQPAFRPGDRVKLNRHSDLYACGDCGTVKRVFGDNVEVRMDLRSVFASRFNVFPAEYLDWVREDDRDVPAPDCAGRKMEQDNGVRPKFKTGDVVKYKDGTRGVGTIKGLYNTSWSSGGVAYEYEDGYWDFESSLELAVPVSNTPCIVALTKNGKPLPATRPFIHASVADATAEAERLARNNPDEEFAVYQRVAGRQCAVSYEMKEVA